MIVGGCAAAAVLTVALLVLRGGDHRSVSAGATSSGRNSSSLDDRSSNSGSQSPAPAHSGGGDGPPVTATPPTNTPPTTPPSGGAVLRIAFDGRASPNGPSSLFVVNPDGRDRRQISPAGSADSYFDAAWSSDHHHFAYVRQVGDKQSVWVTSEIVNGVPDLSHALPVVDGRAPAWSSDATRIAYQVESRNSEYGFDYATLWVTDLTGQATTWSSSGDPEHQLDCFQPSWRARDVEFQATCRLWTYGRPGDAAVFSFDGSQPGGPNPASRFASMSQDRSVSDVSWSHDGTRLAATTCSQDRCNLAVWSADTQAPVQITFTDVDAWPRWSPDDSQLVFESRRSDPNKIENRVWLVTLADGSAHEVFGSDGGRPSW